MSAGEAPLLKVEQAQSSMRGSEPCATSTTTSAQTAPPGGSAGPVDGVATARSARQISSRRRRNTGTTRKVLTTSHAPSRRGTGAASRSSALWWLFCAFGRHDWQPNRTTEVCVRSWCRGRTWRYLAASTEDHVWPEWRYTGMGNSERICKRCGYRQDGMQSDNEVPPCTSAEDHLQKTDPTDLTGQEGGR